jgi:hypothetical protein
VHKVAGIALALSAVALGAAVVALTRRPPEPPRAPARDRVAEALALRVEEIAREVEALKAGRTEQAPTPPQDTPAVPAVVEGGAIETMVDDAVTRKTEQVLDEMRVKQNKKPAWDAFAKALELSDGQRALTERVVVAGQREVHSILGTPTLDGANLIDQLVEIAAKGMAEPGKDHGFGPWLARVLTEKVPGTDETYGARIEAVKGRMRATFKREWSEAQYAEFEAWGVDPTEVQNVPESPNEALMKRITERARALGADVPKD